jgi:beta-phosphoglucomutase
MAEDAASDSPAGLGSSSDPIPHPQFPIPRMKAVIFDFNGVLVDDEPTHFEAFRRVFGARGVPLSRDDYYRRYLGLDDKGCVTAALMDNGVAPALAQVDEIVAEKAAAYRELVADHVPLFPGAAEALSALGGTPLAICSGALRAEIEDLLGRAGLLSRFEVIVAAEDVPRCKPDPAGYLRAYARLAEGRALSPGEVAAVEDSLAGISAAKAAGLFCVAVASTYPAERLSAADRVIDRLDAASLTAALRG